MWEQIIGYIVAGIVTLGAALLTTKYQVVKARLRKIREAIDEVDNALADDRITEEEFRSIYKKFRDIVVG